MFEFINYTVRKKKTKMRLIIFRSFLNIEYKSSFQIVFSYITIFGFVFSVQKFKKKKDYFCFD